MPERNWLVLWDPSGQASTHSCRALKFVEYPNVSAAELQQMQQRYLPPPEPPAVLLQATAANSTTAATVVEQASAPLVAVQNVAIAQNNVVEQPLPSAASTSLQGNDPVMNDQPQEVNQLQEVQEQAEE